MSAVFDGLWWLEYEGASRDGPSDMEISQCPDHHQLLLPFRLTLIMYKYVGVLLTYQQFAQFASNVLERTYTEKGMRDEGFFLNIHIRIARKMPKCLFHCFYLPIACPPSSEKKEDQRIMFVWRVYKNDHETPENYVKVPYRKSDALAIAWLASNGMDLKQMVKQWETLPEIHDAEGFFVPVRYV